MTRAVVYTRVSTAEQVENFSLDTQRRYCDDYCARNEIEVDRVFVDEGASAKTAERAEFQRMLAYCAENRKRLDFVIVYDVSRFSRNMLDYEVVRATLHELGISLRSATQPFDDSPAGELVGGMLAIFANFENRQRAERTVAGMKAALASGRWTHQPPLGYQKPKDRDHGPSLAPDPDRAPLVRLAFERVATGRFSKREVLKEVTSLGLRTKKGRPMSDQSFATMLRNPIYAGRLRVERFGFDGPGDFDPIVDQALFEAVQAVLDGRRPSAAARHRDHPDFPLRRFVRCGSCGRPLTASWSSGRNERYPYYRCPTSGCSTGNVRKEELEAGFVSELETLRVDPAILALFSEVVRDAWRQRHAAEADREKRAAERLQELQRRKDRVVDAYLHEGKLDETTYHEQLTRVDREIEEVHRQQDVNATDRISVERALDFAPRLLTDPPGFWKKLSPDRRPALQRAIYPTGIGYSDGKFGTAETSLIFSYFGEIDASVSEMAPPTGLEPVLPP